MSLMLLPRAEYAIVSIRKITEYLLNAEHPQGWSKAQFFLQFGFRSDEPDTLIRALRQLALTTPMTESKFAFGVKYVGTGTIATPLGRQIGITTVWIVREVGDPPVFVTAYPTSAREK